jgi:hypothetical protein
LLASPSRADELAPRQVEFFETRIRPILVENCFQCHGDKKQKGGLRLDSRTGLLKGGDDGPVIVPGRPDDSRLIMAVRHQGDLKMPPKQKLSPQAIDALAHWVKIGAPWPEAKTAGRIDAGDNAWKRHWAFQSLRSPLLPAVKNQSWPVTTIDRFVLAALEAKGLVPSTAAERHTLIRRATFDLLGLPPTPDEVGAFEADKSPEAFTRVVDRLLASPHYGERWGRHWLDVARYADTKGYVFFQDANFPWAYTYRDYVIRSFNEDLPYDRFILEQLAADQLVGPDAKDRRPLTAMGLVTLGGRFMNNQHDILDDRIDVVTRGLLGLTVTCARCHDHKYDPIPSKDYYALYGVFASSVEPEVPPLFSPPPRTAAYEKYDKELKGREKKLVDFVQTKHTELVKSAHTRAGEYLLAAQALRNQPSTEEFMLIADTNDLNPSMIVRWKVYLEATRKRNDPVFRLWHGLADLPEKELAARAAAWIAANKGGALNSLVVRAFVAKPPKNMKEVAQRYGEVLNKVDKEWQSRLDAGRRTGKEPEFLAAPAMELLQVFYGPEAPPRVPLSAYGDLGLLPDRASQARLQELRKALETWRTSGAGAPPRAMVLEDLPVPVQPRVFLRGNPNNLGPVVSRRFLSALAGTAGKPFRKGSGRLELAQAIASRDNPLTARVLVNRIWLNHFGAGLVRTPSDFGLRSEPPSHPDLLDHLAATFMDDGWSIKKLHRRIMLSRVYQQKSEDRPECQAVDPENRLLWKMNRQRLDFEAMRDALLAVSGRLDRTVGGPSVGNLTVPRRTMYAHLDRLNVPGIYRTFDFPSPDATSPQRDTTTVPQQALYLMNNPFVLDCARGVLGQSEVLKGGDLQQKVSGVYDVLYGRAPSVVERDLAREFIGTGSDAAWQRYVQGLLLVNEFAYVD